MRHAGAVQGSLLIVMSFVLTGCASTASAPDEPTDLRDRFRAMVAEARDSVFPALVHVEVTAATYWDGREQRYRSTGSGTIISPDGLVLTNAHVTDSGIEFFCVLADKTRLRATLVGEDPMTDLALLRLHPDDGESGARFLAAAFGNSDELQVGDQVLAMGSPFALDRTVTYGIVSNTDRVFTAGADNEVEPMFLSGHRTGVLTNWIQHDALINPGNSGGPLVDINGRIIGVNTRGGSGAGFATPSNLAKRVADALAEYGEVPRTTIEIDLLHLERTGFTRGVFVDAVTSDGPAARAGVRPGDVILDVNGQQVTALFPEQIPPVMAMFSERTPGETVQLGILRDSEPMTISVVLERLLPDSGRELALREWGVSIREITPFMARTRRLESTDGVLVAGVRSGGPASLAEIPVSWGDIIQQIDGTPVRTVAEMLKAYEAFLEADRRDERPEKVLVQFDRNGKNYVSLFDTEESKTPEPPRELPKAWIGVATQPIVPELAETLKLGEAGGFRVTRVYPGTTAAEAGLMMGDIIVAVDETEVMPRASEQAGLFGRTIRSLSLSAKPTLSIIRGGERVQLTVPVERSKTTADEARRVTNDDFGLSVRAVTFFDRDDRRWDESIKGVIVVSTTSAGWAETAGIRSDVLIRAIDGEQIDSTRDFERVMERLESEQPERVVFEVLEWYESAFKFVEPDWKPTEIDENEMNDTEAG